MRTLVIAAVVVVPFLVAALAPLRAEPERILTRNLSKNPHFRVDAVRISQARGQNLMIRLVPVRGGEPRVVRFPAHGFTPHETTIMNLVRSLADWSKVETDYEWGSLRAEIVLSLPAETSSRPTELDRWWLVSLKLPKAEGD